MLNIKRDHLQGIPTNKAVEYNGEKLIIIHNTATPNATAQSENTYFHNNWQSVQSFVHALVDWKGDVYETAEFGDVVWGAGNVNKYAFLQVEQCISDDDSDNIQSAKYLAEYVALKIKASGYPFTSFRIISHNDASHEFGGSDHTDTIVGVSWEEFLTDVRNYLPNEVEPEKQESDPMGIFETQQDIWARVDGPDRANVKAYLFPKGTTIKYDRVLKSNGYVWISQPRSSGGYWYIPVSDGVDVWGQFIKEVD